MLSFFIDVEPFPACYFIQGQLCYLVHIFLQLLWRYVYKFAILTHFIKKNLLEATFSDHLCTNPFSTMNIPCYMLTIPKCQGVIRPSTYFLHSLKYSVIFFELVFRYRSWSTLWIAMDKDFVVCDISTTKFQNPSSISNPIVAIFKSDQTLLTIAELYEINSSKNTEDIIYTFLSLLWRN